MTVLRQWQREIRHERLDGARDVDPSVPDSSPHARAHLDVAERRDVQVAVGRVDDRPHLTPELGPEEVLADG
jgi:hypothetical protein